MSDKVDNAIVTPNKVLPKYSSPEVGYFGT